MKLTVRFDITQLIEEEFTEFGFDDWYFEVTDVPFLPQEGIVATFSWKEFIDNERIVSCLDKNNQDIYIGEQTEIIYRSDSVIVYIELVREKEKRRSMFLNSSFNF